MRPAQPIYQYHFEVRLHDTDAAGVLFFAHLFRHAHDAYECFMRALGYPLAELVAGLHRGDGAASRPALPLTHAEADYHAPLRHGDAVVVSLWVDQLRARSFTLRYRFDRVAASGPPYPVAQALTRHVAVRPGRAGACDLPDDLRAMLGAWGLPEHAPPGAR